MRFDDQVALVTGSSRGIGAAVAKRFARFGAKTVINYLDLEGSANRQDAEHVVKTIKGHGHEVMLVQTDVTNPDQVKTMVRQVLDKWQRIDILVNNAGISFRYPFLDDPPDATQKILDVNLQGTLNCCKAVIPHMITQGYGRIVNTASIAAQVGCSVGYAYATAKAGIIGLTRALAVEYAQTGITLNTIAPGTIATKKVMAYDPDRLKVWKEATPMKRFGTLDECAHAILFLASKDAGYITGQVLSINGGQYLSG